LLLSNARSAQTINTRAGWQGAGPHRFPPRVAVAAMNHWKRAPVCAPPPLWKNSAAKGKGPFFYRVVGRNRAGKSPYSGTAQFESARAGPNRPQSDILFGVVHGWRGRPSE
jgi:hypothetical protein